MFKSPQVIVITLYDKDICIVFNVRRLLWLRVIWEDKLSTLLKKGTTPGNTKDIGNMFKMCSSYRTITKQLFVSAYNRYYTIEEK